MIAMMNRLTPDGLHNDCSIPKPPLLLFKSVKGNKKKRRRGIFSFSSCSLFFLFTAKPALCVYESMAQSVISSLAF
jgi:hypothetical protein